LTSGTEAIEAARAAVHAAADLLANARAGEVKGKSNPRDLVTEWDPRVEELIRRILGERMPGVPVLGEEGGGEAKAPAAGLRWVVDPIDGTVNFAHGLPIWSIAIALEDDGRATCGIVAAPALGWWFEATRGGGAWSRLRGYGFGPAAGLGEPQRMAVSTVDRLDRALLVTGFPYDRATNPLNNFAEWEHLQRRAGACRRLGAASIDLCLVAQGRFDGYWERHLNVWDLSAAALIAEEAGATVTDMTGNPLDPYRGAVVASNGAIHEELIAELGLASSARS
jgi:myo-inositol-1(or 4)-monophosphatase